MQGLSQRVASETIHLVHHVEQNALVDRVFCLTGLQSPIDILKKDA